MKYIYFVTYQLCNCVTENINDSFANVVSTRSVDN